MTGGFVRDPRWPRWTDGPGAGGAWKSSPDDFEVEELPREAPTGAGEHQWLWVEKRGCTTVDVAGALARLAGVPPVAVGYAGLKDREARTWQAFTIQGGAPVPDEGPGFRVVRRDLTARKLRAGQLAGNRFRLRIRGGDARLAAERAARLVETGLPNYYGAQRVAAGGPEQGRAALLGRGPRLGHAQLKFVLSALQSRLFNDVLVLRGRRRLPGDLVWDDPADHGADREEGQEEGDAPSRLRLATGPDDPAIPTGPMFGARMRWPEGEARRVEERVLAREALPPSVWERFPKLTQGTRRRLWVPVAPRIEPVEGGFVLSVELPAGSYATVLLEEIL